MAPLKRAKDGDRLMNNPIVPEEEKDPARVCARRHRPGAGAGRRRGWRIARSCPADSGAGRCRSRSRAFRFRALPTSSTKVNPAVVSVRVKSQQPDLSADNQDFPFQFQPGSPMERFFRQFRQMNPNDNGSGNNGNNNNNNNDNGTAAAARILDEPRLGLLHFR